MNEFVKAILRDTLSLRDVKNPIAVANIALRIEIAAQKLHIEALSRALFEIKGDKRETNTEVSVPKVRDVSNRNKP